MKKHQNGYPQASFRSFAAATALKLPLSLGVMMGTMASGAIALTPLVAQASALTQWHYDPATNRLEVTVSQGTTPRYFLMAQPARIVLDLPDTAVGSVKSQGAYSGAVRQIRVSQFQPGLTRIVLELSPEVELAPAQVKLEKVNHSAQSSRWVLSPLIAQAGPLPPVAKAPVAAPAGVSQPSPSVSSTAAISHPAKVSSSPPSPFPVEVPPPVSQVAPAPTLSSPDASLQAVPTAPARVVQAEKVLPPATPIPIGSDDGLQDPDSAQVAQALPPASVTPLPPSSSPADLAIDTRNAVKISVPPPLSNTATQSASVPTSATALPAAAPLPPASVTPPAVSAAPVNPVAGIASPPIAAAPVSSPVASPSTANAFAMDMPSTVRMAPGAAPAISVPPLSNSPAGVVPSAGVVAPFPSASATPVPPPMQLPPLSPLPGSFPVNGQAPAIAVPPAMPASISPAALPSAQVPGTALPPASAVPLQPAPTFSAASVAATPPAANPTMVAFGQPLPTTGAIALNTFPRGVAAYPAPSQPLTGSGQPVGAPASNSQPGSLPPASITPPAMQQAFFQSPNPGVLLPMGATLNLVYPGATALKLPSGPPMQEVLLLQTEVRNASGAVVFPQGTYVLGRFDTSGNGSKFIAQAIAVGPTAIPFAAESNPLGANRGLSATSVAISSGLGALLGGAVSSFSGMGLVGGAAAGAATSVLTTPKQVTVQPGQVIPVQVKQDLLVR